MTTPRAVRDHYRRHWGEPSHEFEFEFPGGLQAAVLKWDASRNPKGVDLYATAGGSAFPMAGQESTHRVEFVLGLLPGKDEAAGWLAGLSLYARREGVAVDHGHTVPADEPYWPGTRMHRFLVWRPGDEVLPMLRLPDGVHVEFLMAIPMYESELTYKQQHGAEGLLDHWRNANVAFWDPERAAEPGPA